MPKKKPGRPPLPDKQDADIRVRCRASDKKRWEKAARKAKVPFPAFVRAALDAACS